jgi:hypothetical protein
MFLQFCLIRPVSDFRISNITQFVMLTSINVFELSSLTLSGWIDG